MAETEQTRAGDKQAEPEWTFSEEELDAWEKAADLTFEQEGANTRLRQVIKALRAERVKSKNTLDREAALMKHLNGMQERFRLFYVDLFRIHGS